MLKKILGGAGALLLALIVLGFVLPDKAHVEREIVINAPQEEVYALVSDYREWNRWSPWANIDPDAEYSLIGEGVGQRMEWTSDHPQVGNGAQEITALDPPNTVVSALDFGDMGKASAIFELSAQDENMTKVVWSFDSNMREGAPVYMKPMATYMGFFMDSFLGKDYEAGLANLKQAAEAG